MASDPAFASTPGTELIQFSTANTARDGSGTVGTLLGAGAAGSRVERLWFKATGTTTAGMVRVFAYDGTNIRLIAELPVTAITVTSTVESWEGEIVYGDDDPLILPTGWGLRCSTHIGETFNGLAVAGDF